MSRQTKPLSRQHQAILEEYRSHKLLEQANDATEKSGRGRLKHKDGTHTDIGPHTGGATRKLLNVPANISVDDMRSTADTRDAPVRIANDGQPYNFLQFMEYYGKHVRAQWEAAIPATH